MKTKNKIVVPSLILSLLLVGWMVYNERPIEDIGVVVLICSIWLMLVFGVYAIIYRYDHAHLKSFCVAGSIFLGNLGFYLSGGYEWSYSESHIPLMLFSVGIGMILLFVSITWENKPPGRDGGGMDVQNNSATNASAIPMNWNMALGFSCVVGYIVAFIIACFRTHGNAFTVIGYSIPIWPFAWMIVGILVVVANKKLQIFHSRIKILVGAIRMGMALLVCYFIVVGALVGVDIYTRPSLVNVQVRIEGESGAKLLANINDIDSLQFDNEYFGIIYKNGYLSGNRSWFEKELGKRVKIFVNEVFVGEPVLIEPPIGPSVRFKTTLERNQANQVIHDAYGK